MQAVAVVARGRMCGPEWKEEWKAKGVLGEAAAAALCPSVPWQFIFPTVTEFTFRTFGGQASI